MKIEVVCFYARYGIYMDVGQTGSYKHIILPTIKLKV